MDNFFKERLARHQKKMMRYMRYVLNDHFVLVCLFLVGGLGFYYSNLLKQLPADFIWSLPIVGVVWWFILPFGSLATLVEPADMTFLLPKETEMTSYLNKSLRHSLPFPFLVEGLIGGALMPLVALAQNSSFNRFFPYLIMLWALKYSHLTIEKFASYQETASLAKKISILWFLLSGCIIFVGLYFGAIIGGIAALVLMTGMISWLNRHHRLLDWTFLINRENQRLHRIYQFINLFTDVPEIEAKVKRRRYLDPFLSKISFKQENTYLYLFARRAFRGSEISGLFLRLVVLGGVIIFSLNDFIFSAGVSALFIYLIGFQLIPLYSQFDYVTLTQLYPVAKKTKEKALQKLITGLLATGALIFSLCTLGRISLLESGLVFGILVIEIVVFSMIYLPIRVKKMEA